MVPCPALPRHIALSILMALSAEACSRCRATGSDFAGTLLRCGPEQQASGPPELQIGDAVMGTGHPAVSDPQWWQSGARSRGWRLQWRLRQLPRFPPWP